MDFANLDLNDIIAPPSAGSDYGLIPGDTLVVKVNGTPYTFRTLTEGGVSPTPSVPHVLVTTKVAGCCAMRTLRNNGFLLSVVCGLSEGHRGWHRVDADTAIDMADDETPWAMEWE